MMLSNGRIVKFPNARIRPYKCKHFKWTSWNHYGCKMWEFGCLLKGGSIGSCNGVCENFERK